MVAVGVIVYLILGYDSFSNFRPFSQNTAATAAEVAVVRRQFGVIARSGVGHAYLYCFRYVFLILEQLHFFTFGTNRMTEFIFSVTLVSRAEVLDVHINLESGRGALIQSYQITNVIPLRVGFNLLQHRKKRYHFFFAFSFRYVSAYADGNR
jgi:hypothetical protein